MRGAHIVIPDTLREGLLSGLEDHSRVFLSAGPGWGKTAAVHRLLERGECTFLSLGRRAPFPCFGKKRLVVLDDIQRLTPPEERELANQLLRAPRGQRFVLLSRAPLPDCLSPLAAAGEVLVLGQELLALNGLAVSLLASDAGLDLSRETLAAVEKATGGYPLAVRLLLEQLTLGQPLEQGIDRMSHGVGAYLEGICRRELGDGPVELLTRLSLFPTFDGELAALLIGEQSAGETLRRAARLTGLLRRTDRDWAFSAGPWFSAYLQRKAKALLPPEELRQIFRAGGRWYEARGDGLRSAECWRRAGDRERMKDLLIQQFRYPTDIGSWYQMAEVYRQLTETEIQSSPELICARSMLCSVTGDPVGAEDWYRRLGEQSIHNSRCQELTAYLELALPHRPVGTPKQIASAAKKKAHGEWPERPRLSLSQGLPSLLRGSRDFSAWAGQDERDLETACKAVEGALGQDGVGFEALMSMELLLEQGGDVSRHLLEMETLRKKLRAQGTKEMEFVLAALLARALYAAGHMDQALEVLSAFRLGLKGREDRRIPSNLDALRCRLGLMRGDSYAEEWYRKQAHKEKSLLRLEYYRCLTLVRCCLKREDHCSALLLLGKLLPFTQEYHRPLDRIEALLLAAICRFRMGGGDWRDLLCQALALGEQYGYVAVFAREGAALLPLAERLEHRPVCQEYWQRVLGAVIELAGCYPDYLRPAVQLIRSLTSTEKLVLRLLCQNKSIAQICALLEIKVPTAKTHIQHIYRKLGVHSKAGVLKAAKDLRLLKG